MPVSSEYALGDLIGLTMFAKNTVDVYTNKPVKYNLDPVGTVAAGNPIGVVYSYVTDDDGSILLMFQGSNSNYANTLGSYFVELTGNVFDVSSLKSQGLLSIDEKAALAAAAAAKANMTIGDYITKYVGWALLAYAGVHILTALINKKTANGPEKI